MSKTYGEQFKEASACETKEQADEWLAAEIERYRVDYGQDEPKAKSVIMGNLGYMAGYYDDATAKKINRLFGATHPIFGGDNYHNTVTPEQAYEVGIHGIKEG